jgi:regulator of sigma E protease
VSYFLAFLAFAALIILHEAGHFAAAKAVGMRVEKFSLFFGPMIARKQIGETVYGIGTIPLGGYVKITGMSEVEFAGVDFVSAHEEEDVKRRAYYNQPVWKRIVVIAAGPAVNLLIAFILVWVLFLGNSHYVTTKAGYAIPTTSTVTKIAPHTPADGTLKVGDQIVSVDGASVEGAAGDPNLVHAGIEKHKCAHDARTNGCRATTPVTMVIKRDGQLKTLRIYPRYNAKAKYMAVGFNFNAAFRTEANNIFYSAGHSVTELGHVTGETVSHLVQLFKPKYRRQIQGVVGAYYETATQISDGTDNAIWIIALISLSLGIINLFPFLPLDGGHIFWALVEKVRGQRVSVRTMEMASIVGIVLILGLFALGMVNSVHLISTGKT